MSHPSTKRIGITRRPPVSHSAAVDQLKQLCDVVAVRARQDDRERRAVSVRGERSPASSPTDWTRMVRRAARSFRTHGVDPLYSTLTQTNTEVHSLPVSGFLAGSVLMYRCLPSILNWRTWVVSVHD